MAYEDILVEKRGSVLWLYMNRPQEMNALNSRMMIEMSEVLDRARGENDVRVLVLTAKGRAFCAGADLKAVGDPMAPPTGERDFFDYSQKTFAELRAFPKPVIVALNGTTCAGGLELALCGDIIFAGKSVKIGDAHSNFGLLPGAGNSVRLARQLGPLRAKHMMFTGDFFPAEEMLAMGLVNRVVADDVLETEVQALAERLAEKSPLGLRRMKELVRDTAELPLEVALRHEHIVSRDHMRSHDVAEGLKAFREKRKPNFKGY